MAIEFLKHLDKSIKYLHRQGAFLTVKDKDGRENVMTISSGNIGFEWGRPVFTVLVRRSRFTHDLLENTQDFTVSIPLSTQHKKLLVKNGSMTGRENDKFNEIPLTKMDSNKVSSPHIAEADVVYECKLVYKHHTDASMFTGDIIDTSYRDGDFHDIYYGEIVDCYVQGDK